ncbi:MAG TPA: peptidoglycan editing factor PgeF [Candidatus Brocadiaceae bacterium]
MIEKNGNTLPLLYFGSFLRQREINHFVSTRNGGYSNPPYNSLNLGFHVGDDPQLVLKNRGRLASAIGVPFYNFTFAKQIHDCNVKVVTESLRGSGAFEYATSIEATDALVTDIPNICLTVLHADCVPVILFDFQKRVIGVVHAGWKGTMLQVTRNTVMVFREKFGSAPENIIAGIGPSIGPCCYKVGPEIIIQAKKVLQNKKGHIYKKTSGGNGYFDLWEANKIQLLHTGIPEKNIEIAQICTYCNHDIFFSYRYQKGETGRVGTGIMLK